MSLEQWTQIAEIGEAVATAVALAVGGFWSYRLFVEKRLGWPRVSTELVMNHAALPEGVRLVHAEVVLSNTGLVMVAPVAAELRLRQVIPLPDFVVPIVDAGYDPVVEGRQEIEWPMIAGRQWNWSKGEFEIEPGEVDRLHADFAIDRNIQVIQFYFFLHNARKKRQSMGWSLTQIENLKESEAGDMAEQNDRARMIPLQGRQEKQQVPQQRQMPQQQQQTQQQQKVDTTVKK